MRSEAWLKALIRGAYTTATEDAQTRRFFSSHLIV